MEFCTFPGTVSPNSLWVQSFRNEVLGKAAEGENWMMMSCGHHPIGSAAVEKSEQLKSNLWDQPYSDPHSCHANRVVLNHIETQKAVQPVLQVLSDFEQPLLILRSKLPLRLSGVSC